MPALSWDSTNDAELLRLRSQGLDWTTLGHKWGVGEGVVRRRCKKLAKAPPQQVSVDAEVVEQFNQSAMRAELDRLRGEVAKLQKANEPKRVQVECDAVPPIDAAELWKRCEEESVRAIQYAHDRSRFRVTLPNEPVAVVFVSDQHIAPGTPVDFARMRDDAELIAATNGAYAVLGGDGVDNHIVIRSAVLAARSQPHDQWRLFEYYLEIFADKIMAMCSGNHDCLDDDTELCTKRGWVRHDDIQSSDEVLGIDTDTGQSRWQAIGKVIRYQHDGIMRQMRTRCVDLMCTTNHRILHKKHGGSSSFSDGQWTFTEASRFNSGSHYLPIAAPSGNPEYPIEDDILRIAGWLLTDGSIAKRCGKPSHIVFSQRKSKSWMITDILDRLGLAYVLSERHRKIAAICGRSVKSTEPEHTIRLGTLTSKLLLEYIPQRGALPSWVDKLSDRQFGVFLDSMIDGDGNRPKTGIKSAVLYKDESLLSQVQVACVRHGWSANLRQYRPGQFALDICKRVAHRVDAVGKFTDVAYSGVAWCLRVPFGNFLVRRNGKAFYTGNSWTDQVSGVDMLARIAASQKLCYAPAEARIVVSVGEQKYNLGMRHQYRMNSSFNMGHAVKQWFRMGEEAFDIGVIGHHHEPCVESFEAHGLTRWAARPGAYQITSSYSRQYGFNSTKPTCPTFVLMPDQRHIIGFRDLRDGLRHLKALRGDA